MQQQMRQLHVGRDNFALTLMILLLCWQGYCDSAWSLSLDAIEVTEGLSKATQT